MPRVVLDPGVVISGLLNPDGPPGRLLRAWSVGTLELVISPHWLREVHDVVRRPKIARRVDAAAVADLLASLPRAATLVPDAPVGAPISRDPDDDYLVMLADQVGAVLVSGDLDLTTLEVPSLRILTPAQAVASLLAG